MKVLKNFRDKEDDYKLYTADSKTKYAHKNKARTADLVDKGFIEAPKEEKPKKEAKKDA